MRTRLEQMEIARVSSKGQLVIPQSLRERLKIKEGSLFALSSFDNTLLLKKIENPISGREIKTMKMVEEAWGDIAKGKYRKFSKADFLKELERW